MEFLQLDSSSLKEAAYYPKRLILIIVFKNGAIYSYNGVPKTKYNEFLNAESKGNFFNKYIKEFPYQKIS